MNLVVEETYRFYWEDYEDFLGQVNVPESVFSPQGFPRPDDLLPSDVMELIDIVCPVICRHKGALWSYDAHWVNNDDDLEVTLYRILPTDRADLAAFTALAEAFLDEKERIMGTIHEEVRQ